MAACWSELWPESASVLQLHAAGMTTGLQTRICWQREAAHSCKDRMTSLRGKRFRRNLARRTQLTRRAV